MREFLQAFRELPQNYAILLCATVVLTAYFLASAVAGMFNRKK